MCEGMFGLERWSILAPLRKQGVGLEVGYDLGCWLKQGEFGKAIGGPKGFCVINNSFDAFHRLYRPPVDVQNLALVQLDRALKKRKGLASLSPIEKLPLELMSSIYLYLQPAEYITLGLCSHSLWVRAVTGIRHVRHLSSWADTPIFLAGSGQLFALRQAIYDTKPGIQPPRKETYDIVRETIDLQNHYMFDVLKEAWNKNLLRNYPSLTFSDVGPPYCQELSRLLPFSGIPESLYGLIESCLGSEELGGEGQWYLRDYTTNEYIRMERVQDHTISKHTTVSLAGNPWMTLDILLVWLITWQGGNDKISKEVPGGNPKDQIKAVFTNGSSVSEPEIAQIRSYFMDMYFGRWSGHSLDVVKLGQAKMGSGWSDITGEIEDVSQRWFAGIYLEAHLLKETEYIEYWDRFVKDQMNK